jgi:hypothetical protein
VGVKRYDFKAVIKTGTGENKKVLIEIQKGRNAEDIMRFRNYLAKQYATENEVKTGFGIVNEPLHIITIYLLGFNLQGIDAAALKVDRQYTDILTHTVIRKKHEFIESLTHDCYVVQLTKIHVKVLNVLEELLSVFEQINFADDKGTIKMYNHEIKNEVIKSMLDMLHYAGTDPEKKKEIDLEVEAWRTFDALTGNKQVKELRAALEQSNKEKASAKKELAKSKKELKETEQALEEKQRALKENEMALIVNKKALKEKEKALEEERKDKENKDKKLEILAKELAEIKKKLGL